MKNKITYFIFTTLIAILSCSCGDDKQEKTSLAGTWNYEKPHFLFEYAQDSVSIVMGKGQKKSIAVADLKVMFNQMATEKMGAYFKGAQFDMNGNMKINMSFQDGKESAVRATYIQTGNIIEIALDSNDMKALAGTAKIPPISFKYILANNRLTMYFDHVYIETVYGMMQNQLITRLLPMLGMDVSTLPPANVARIKEAMKLQIQAVLDNINKLEIGFVLTRASSTEQILL